MNLKDYLFKHETVSFQAEASNWKEAVKLGTELLLKSGAIEERYYDAIIENTEKLGPYYLLAPGIAMPHARPEGGALSTGYSLVTLKEPVEFGDEFNDPIDIIVTMAATNAETQNETAIVQIASLMDSDERVEALRKITSLSELEPLFEGLDEE